MLQAYFDTTPRQSKPAESQRTSFRLVPQNNRKFPMLSLLWPNIDLRCRYRFILAQIVKPFVKPTQGKQMMRLGCLQIRISAAVLVVAALALHGVAFGQASFEGQIRGEVRDAAGAVVPGAKLAITDVSTGISNSTQTDNRGTYIFNGLRPATYSLRAEMAGFRPAESTNIVLGVSQYTSHRLHSPSLGSGKLRHDFRSSLQSWTPGAPRLARR